MPEVVSAICCADSGHKGPDGAAQIGHGALGVLTKERFELAEGHLDWIKVWRVLGQVFHGCASDLDRFSHAGRVVCSEIVHHDDILRFELWRQHLFDVSPKHLAGHAAVRRHWCEHAIAA